jgi:hypothetical protein
VAEPVGERLDFYAESDDNAAQSGGGALCATESQPRLTWRTFVERRANTQRFARAAVR